MGSKIDKEGARYRARLDKTLLDGKVTPKEADALIALLGVEEKNGQKLVQLRNPWGEREPGHDGHDDGIFTMPLEKFMTSFATVEFAKP